MLTNNYYVYILSSKNKVLYTGVTDNLKRRIYEHKNKTEKNSFTARYNATNLVYYEVYHDIKSAIMREKQIKANSREYKLNLIEQNNPEYIDLYNEL